MLKRRLAIAILLLLTIGLGNLSRTLGRADMDRVRAVNIVSLTGSGFCFGVAFGFFVLMLGGRLKADG